MQSRHALYGVPLVRQKSIGSLKFTGYPEAVHTIPLRPGVSLDFYARLRRSDELIVTLTGAKMNDKNTYPRFARVRSVKGKAPAFLAFDDPTWQLDPDRQMLLAWFLGGPSFEPAAPILRTIRRAQKTAGARHIAFIGGSGGGFAALRLSSMVPGSMAFVNDPSTNIANSLPSTVTRYFNTAWPGWDQEDLLEAFPDRFDMVRHYTAHAPGNYVYYTQSTSDEYYLERHCLPFMKACQLSTGKLKSRDGRRVFSLYEGAIPGHGKIQPEEFDHYYNAAFAGWRSHRA